MALKFMLLVLLMVAAINAAPAHERGDEEENDDDVDQDENEIEEDPKKSKVYCACKPKVLKGDEPMSEEELADQVTQFDPRKMNPSILINKNHLKCVCTRKKPSPRVLAGIKHLKSKKKASILFFVKSV